MGEGRGEGFLPYVSPYALTRLASLATLSLRERERNKRHGVFSTTTFVSGLLSTQRRRLSMKILMKPAWVSP